MEECIDISDDDEVLVIDEKNSDSPLHCNNNESPLKKDDDITVLHYVLAKTPEPRVLANSQKDSDMDCTRLDSRLNCEVVTHDENTTSFFIDTECANGTDNTILPEYEMEVETILSSNMEADTRKHSERFNKIICFNCSGGHRISECKIDKDEQRICKNKRKFRKNNPITFPRGCGVRYHAAVSNSSFNAGYLSDNLRNIMGLRWNELPNHIYNMRMYGYPPGWEKYAIETDEGLKLYDARNTTSEKKLEKLTVNEEKVHTYAGFNSPVVYPYFDDYLSKRVPRYSDRYCRRNYIQQLRYRLSKIGNFNSANGESKLKLSQIYSDRGDSNFPCETGSESDQSQQYSSLPQNTGWYGTGSRYKKPEHLEWREEFPSRNSYRYSHRRKRYNPYNRNRENNSISYPSGPRRHHNLSHLRHYSNDYHVQFVQSNPHAEVREGGPPIPLSINFDGTSTTPSNSALQNDRFIPNYSNYHHRSILPNPNFQGRFSHDSHFMNEGCLWSNRISDQSEYERERVNCTEARIETSVKEELRLSSDNIKSIKERLLDESLCSDANTILLDQNQIEKHTEDSKVEISELVDNANFMLDEIKENNLLALKLGFESDSDYFCMKPPIQQVNDCETRNLKKIDCSFDLESCIRILRENADPSDKTDAKSKNYQFEGVPDLSKFSVGMNPLLEPPSTQSGKLSSLIELIKVRQKK